MNHLLSNIIFFAIFSAVSYYFNMPVITIIGFFLWLVLILLSESEAEDTRNEMILKINFLLRGDADYIKSLKDKIEKLEDQISNINHKLDEKQDKTQITTYEHWSDDLD